MPIQKTNAKRRIFIVEDHALVAEFYKLAL
jgi:hypothetical protein